jgi:hypothetical protein
VEGYRYAKKIMVALLLKIAHSYVDETANVRVCEPDTDEERIAHLLESIQPLLAFCRERSFGHEKMEMISYEIVKDRKTNALAALNFKAEPFFPVASREEYVRIAMDTFILDHTGNVDGSHRISAAQAIARGLNEGSVSLYRGAGTIASILSADESFFATRGLRSEHWRLLNSFLVNNLEEAKMFGSLSSVKLYTLVI